MATAYLRPSSDIDFKHTPSSGSTGYNLINEAISDGDSTTINGADGSSSELTTTSKFRLTGTISSGHKIDSASCVVVAKMSRTSDAKQSSLIISVGSSSSSQEVDSTSYKSFTYALSASDISVSGTTATADLTLTTTLRNDKETVYCYITQVYIQVSTSSDITYTISTTGQGTGTVSGSGTYSSGSSPKVSISPGSGLSISSVTDNGTDKTSSLTYVSGEPSSSVTATASGASYGFAQSGNYWVSQNTGTKNSAAICQLNITCSATATLTLGVINYAEATYDYGIVGAVDQTLGTTYTKDSGTTWDGSTSSANTSSEQTITISIPSGTHFVQLKYRKDQATNSNNDNFQWRIKSLTYNTPQDGHYEYTVSNISTNHTIVVTFSDYSVAPTYSKFHIKIGGTWINAKTAYQKVNGVWTKITTTPTNWNSTTPIQWNPWLLNASLSKSGTDASQSGFVTTTYIPIQANTSITIHGASGSAGIMFNTYKSDGTYYDWWSSGSDQVTTIDSVNIYTRTLEAEKVASCTFVKVNINQLASDYCKVYVGSNLVFDGSCFPIS